MSLLQTSVSDFQFDPGTLIGAIVILIGAYIGTRLVASILSAVAERSVRRRISIKMFIPVTKFLIYGVATYLILGPLLRLSAAQLLAVSGLIGAALGFGLKDLFAGLVGGLIIIFEKPYQVGDKVSIGDHYGEVTDIGLRATTLTTPDDSAVVVPNDTLFSQNVANANDGHSEMMVVVEVSIAPDADLEQAMKIMEDALVTSKFVFIDETHPVAVLVEDQPYYRTIRGKAYVSDLRDEFAFVSDVTERTLLAFEEHDVNTPEMPVHSVEE